MTIEPVDKRIVKFLKKHHVVTLATTDTKNSSWCANCFYVYLESENMLVFTSDIETKHIKNGLQQPKVSGSIVLETNIIGKIQGIQFTGELLELKSEGLKLAQMSYLLRFPMAALMKTTLWAVSLNYLKMTDNQLGFGKKLIWEKNN